MTVIDARLQLDFLLAGTAFVTTADVAKWVIDEHEGQRHVMKDSSINCA
jgi:hypothetical protein